MKISSPIFIGVGEPLDSRFSVNNTSDLATLASSGLAYAYMKVVNKQDGYTYELQPDMTTWSLFTAKGPKGDKGNPGPKGDPGPALEVGTVQLVEGDSADLQIWKGTDGKLNFKLTLPSNIF